MRMEDLLPAFAKVAGELDILHEVDLGDSNLFECLARPGNCWGVPDYGWLDIDAYDLDSDASHEDLIALMDALDSYAYDYGLTFGTLEGDGSDFGFWPFDEEVDS